jgi:hypothetical protein
MNWEVKVEKTVRRCLRQGHVQSVRHDMDSAEVALFCAEQQLTGSKLKKLDSHPPNEGKEKVNIPVEVPCASASLQTCRATSERLARDGGRVCRER